MKDRSVFLDRDGVLVIPEFRDGRSYAPRSLDRFALYPAAAPALAALKAAGFRIIVVSNQPDVGNGLVERAVVEDMNRILAATLPVDAVLCCYHSQKEACACRKPKPGMLQEAAHRFSLDLSASFMVGDRASDVEAGRAAGTRTVFIDLGYTREPRPEAPDWVVTDVAAASAVILANGDDPAGSISPTFPS
ncbi:D,D-heptose 1,7-bisphosphate phosphatase [uncultured Gammaproteobacteria bacterium]